MTQLLLTPTCALMLTAIVAAPLTAQTKPQSSTTHRTAPTHTAHHAVRPVSCPVPEPAMSPNIPAAPAGLGCPRILYALTYIDLRVGTGELAAPDKFYTVHYTGYLPDGTKFDSSWDHPGAQPITFPYGAHRVIPGWDTGFEGMRVGGKRRLFVPYQLAYGEMGRPPVIPPKAELIFDVELVGQSDTPPPPPASEAAPPQGQAPSHPAETPSGSAASPTGATPPPAQPQR